jgi:hypothetical protein
VICGCEFLHSTFADQLSINYVEAATALKFESFSSLESRPGVLALLGCAEPRPN